MKTASSRQDMTGSTMLKLTAIAAISTAAAITAAPTHAAEIKLPPIEIGAGARTSFTSLTADGVAPNTNDFAVESVRLYITGTALPWLKLTVNTEYGGDNRVQVMDAIARFEFSPEVNIWAGRFLPPSDRSNLYGPYYANHWGVYRDGVEDGYANTAVGRDNGVAYWGDFGGLKVSAGLFDVPSTTGGSAGDSVITAGRLQYDFWDKESGYFLNSTYYGAKDLLAIGAAGQTADGDTSYTFDFLLEKKLPGVGVFTVESEYARYKGLTGGGLGTESTGATGLVSYLFPEKLGIGTVQLLGKYAESTPKVVGPNPTLKTTEFNLGYVVKEFNARGYLFFIRQVGTAATPNTSAIGVGLQVQI